MWNFAAAIEKNNMKVSSKNYKELSSDPAISSVDMSKKMKTEYQKAICISKFIVAFFQTAQDVE